jgi:hypothetical protein
MVRKMASTLTTIPTRTPRFFSIELEDRFQPRPLTPTRIDLNWKGNQLSDALKKHATHHGVAWLSVYDLDTSFRPNSAKRDRIIMVKGEWRDFVPLTHPGMVIDSLAPAVVDTALMMFIQTAARERTERGEMCWPDENVIVALDDIDTKVWELTINSQSPPMFVGEPIALIPPEIRGNGDGVVFYAGAAPEGVNRQGLLKAKKVISE